MLQYFADTLRYHNKITVGPSCTLAAKRSSPHQKSRSEVAFKMQMTDAAQTRIIGRPSGEIHPSADRPRTETYSAMPVGFQEFGRRGPSSIEKALYGSKPGVTFEVSLAREGKCLGFTWLMY